MQLSGAFEQNGPGFRLAYDIREEHVMRNWILRGIAALVLMAMLGIQAAAAFDEPDGFGGVKFGASPDTAKKAFPSMTMLGVPGGGQPGWLKGFVVEKQAVGPLKDCRVELRF